MNYNSKIRENYSSLRLLFTGLILVFGFGSVLAKNHIESKNSAKFEQCLQAADLTDIKQRQSNAIAMNIKVGQLCNENQRNKAQNIAISLALKLHASKNVIRYRNCSKYYEDSQNTSFNLLLKYHVSKLRFTHICDVE